MKCVIFRITAPIHRCQATENAIIEISWEGIRSYTMGKELNDSHLTRFKGILCRAEFPSTRVSLEHLGSKSPGAPKEMTISAGWQPLLPGLLLCISQGCGSRRRGSLHVEVPHQAKQGIGMDSQRFRSFYIIAARLLKRVQDRLAFRFFD